MLTTAVSPPMTTVDRGTAGAWHLLAATMRTRQRQPMLRPPAAQTTAHNPLCHDATVPAEKKRLWGPVISVAGIVGVSRADGHSARGRYGSDHAICRQHLNSRRAHRCAQRRTHRKVGRVSLVGPFPGCLSLPVSCSSSRRYCSVDQIVKNIKNRGLIQRGLVGREQTDTRRRHDVAPSRVDRPAA